MSNELRNELKIELSCGNCSFGNIITIGLDTDGVFTIPNKFCPNDLTELRRDVLRNFVSEPESKPDEPTKDKTKSANTVPKPTRVLEVPKHGANRPERTKH